MAVDDILVFKRTVIVQKQGLLSEQTITTVALDEVDANLVLRHSSNGFYTYDVVIKGKQVTAAGIVELKFIITSSQDDKADVTGVTIGAIGATETLLATDTVKTGSVNNVLSTHTLSVYAVVT